MFGLPELTLAPPGSCLAVFLLAALANNMFMLPTCTLASPGSSLAGFQLTALAENSGSKIRQRGPFGTLKSYILAKFHHPSPKNKTNFRARTANCGDPLTGTERCNEKGNLLASLGG